MISNGRIHYDETKKRSLAALVLLEPFQIAGSGLTWDFYTAWASYIGISVR